MILREVAIEETSGDNNDIFLFLHIPWSQLLGANLNSHFTHKWKNSESQRCEEVLFFVVVFTDIKKNRSVS